MRDKTIFDLLAAYSSEPPPAGANFLDHLAPTTGENSTLAALIAEASSCSRCRLRGFATQVVFADGDPSADLMLVGEGPGAEEDRQGLPFVGAAGQLLNRILEAAGISRTEVYIANVVKCRPPGNRLPQRDEVEACLPYLKRQIELVRPKIIVCLGSLATQSLLDPKARVSAVRGRWHELAGIRFMATYHPAALLRDPAKKRPVWEDIKQVRDLYRQIRQGR